MTRRKNQSQTTVNLNVLVVQVRRVLEPLTRGREVRWSVEQLPAVQGDPMLLLLWQALTELLVFLLEDTWEEPEPWIRIDAQVLFLVNLSSQQGMSALNL
ncbi:hypothetical protein E7T06_18460 [Deinococcus sp. Arct2-2]|uniref:hypothetical protein n=1 Tax=Deinococcus sp. Arct2-2 TaxID=2568653 RepID=UPI0010A2EE90|nr:hypothetical protein [Deinococcus sp. Arct2-2]THF68022.1 hypothetical protein E7T06_18460 [Deinococcus sp. Arct2-2]